MLILAVMVCTTGFNSSVSARTMVVQISAYNPAESVHGYFLPYIP